MGKSFQLGVSLKINKSDYNKLQTKLKKLKAFDRRILATEDDMLELGIPSSYAMQFKGKGIREVNLPARPFFFSSARVGFKNLYKRVDNRLRNIIR